MKNNYQSFGLLLVTAIIASSSCEKKKYYEINVNVENGSAYSAYINKIKAITYEEEDVVIATADYNNGITTLKLPLTITENLYYLSEYADEELIFSKPDVKVADLLFFACDDSEYVSDIYYIAENKTETSMEFIQGMYMYSDSDCSLTENYEYDGSQVTSNANLKIGWNLLYAIQRGAYDPITDTITHTREITSTPQSGLKWHLVISVSSESPKTTHKSFFFM
ncbi:MAG: hypothetical protein LBT04_01705 [Prevotellaceae bacterium]|jgi:hypothetical protein|nr:hypothetical protein [Prevotellaceae bacterium]